jgi:AcrR family transcriptional regulator
VVVVATGVSGLRDRKKDDTRKAISRAALLLAVERGPDGITVDDIAAAAGVSPRTVFNYFATKEYAILGLSPVRALEVARAVRERPADEAPLTALREALTEIAVGTPELAELTRLRSRLVRDHPQLHPHHAAGQTLLESALVDAVSARIGVSPTSAYPHLVVATAIAAFRTALDRARPGRAALVAAINEAFAILETGLASPR